MIQKKRCWKYLCFAMFFLTAIAHANNKNISCFKIHPSFFSLQASSNTFPWGKKGGMIYLENRLLPYGLSGNVHETKAQRKFRTYFLLYLKNTFLFSKTPFLHICRVPKQKMLPYLIRSHLKMYRNQVRGVFFVGNFKPVYVFGKKLMSIRYSMKYNLLYKILGKFHLVPKFQPVESLSYLYYLALDQVFYRRANNMYHVRCGNCSDASILKHTPFIFGVLTSYHKGGYVRYFKNHALFVTHQLEYFQKVGMIHYIERGNFLSKFKLDGEKTKTLIKNLRGLFNKEDISYLFISNAPKNYTVPKNPSQYDKRMIQKITKIGLKIFKSPLALDFLNAHGSAWNSGFVTLNTSFKGGAFLNVYNSCETGRKLASYTLTMPRTRRLFSLAPLDSIFAYSPMLERLRRIPLLNKLVRFLGENPVNFKNLLLLRSLLPMGWVQRAVARNISVTLFGDPFLKPNLYGLFGTLYSRSKIKEAFQDLGYSELISESAGN